MGLLAYWRQRRQGSLVVPASPPAAAEERGFTQLGNAYWPNGGETEFYQTGDRYADGHTGRHALHSIAFACVNGISQDISTLAPEVGLLDSSSGFTRQPSSMFQQLLDVPNPYQTNVDFMAYVIASLLYTGNAYVYTPRDRDGNPTALHPLDPRSVTVALGDGELFYQVTTQVSPSLTPTLDGRVYIPKRELLHIPYLLLSSPIIGIGPLAGAALALSQHGAMTRNAAGFFRNQAQPSGILSGPNKISKELAARIRDHWTTNFSHGRFGSVAVMGEGLAFTPMTMTATDAQLIEQLRWTSEDIARAFRYPLFLLGDLTKATFKNTEAQWRTYYSQCLRPIVEKMEAAMDRHFGFPFESQKKAVRYNLDPLLRTEQAERYQSYATAIAGGFKTINEVRKKEGDAPIDGGDEPLVQMQYQPLSQVTNPPAPAPEKGASVELLRAAVNRCLITARSVYPCP